MIWVENNLYFGSNKSNSSLETVQDRTPKDLSLSKIANVIKLFRVDTRKNKVIPETNRTKKRSRNKGLWLYKVDCLKTNFAMSFEIRREFVPLCLGTQKERLKKGYDVYLEGKIFLENICIDIIFKISENYLRILGNSFEKIKMVLFYV